MPWPGSAGGDGVPWLPSLESPCFPSVIGECLGGSTSALLLHKLRLLMEAQQIEAQSSLWCLPSRQIVFLISSTLVSWNSEKETYPFFLFLNLFLFFILVLMHRYLSYSMCYRSSPAALSSCSNGSMLCLGAPPSGSYTSCCAFSFLKDFLSGSTRCYSLILCSFCLCSRINHLFLELSTV